LTLIVDIKNSSPISVLSQFTKSALYSADSAVRQAVLAVDRRTKDQIDSLPLFRLTSPASQSMINGSFSL